MGKARKGDKPDTKKKRLLTKMRGRLRQMQNQLAVFRILLRGQG